jgi:hypothetical protein
MAHIGDFSETMCSLSSGAKPPARAKTDATSKESVVAHVRESFGYCTTALANLDDNTLSRVSRSSVHRSHVPVPSSFSLAIGPTTTP